MCFYRVTVIPNDAVTVLFPRTCLPPAWKSGWSLRKKIGLIPPHTRTRRQVAIITLMNAGPLSNTTLLGGLGGDWRDNSEISWPCAYYLWLMTAGKPGLPVWLIFRFFFPLVYYAVGGFYAKGPQETLTSFVYIVSFSFSLDEWGQIAPARQCHTEVGKKTEVQMFEFICVKILLLNSKIIVVSLYQF